MKLNSCLVERLGKVFELEWLRRCEPDVLYERLRDAYFMSERSGSDSVVSGELRGVWYTVLAYEEDLFKIEFGPKSDSEQRFRCQGKLFSFNGADGTDVWMLLSSVAVGASSQYRLCERALPSDTTFQLILDPSMIDRSASTPRQPQS